MDGPPQEAREIKIAPRSNIMVVEDTHLAAVLGAVFNGTSPANRLVDKCEVFKNPQEALDTFRQRPQDFDAVVVDQIMPGMIGTRLVEEIRKLKPSITTVLLSSHTREDLPKDTFKEIDVAVDKRGFGMDKARDLARQVKAVIAQKKVSK